MFVFVTNVIDRYQRERSNLDVDSGQLTEFDVVFIVNDAMTVPILKLVFSKVNVNQLDIAHVFVTNVINRCQRERSNLDINCLTTPVNLN